MQSGNQNSYRSPADQSAQRQDDVINQTIIAAAMERAHIARAEAVRTAFGSIRKSIFGNISVWSLSRPDNPDPCLASSQRTVDCLQG